MPLCESFEKLTPLEKSTYIGKICHIYQSDEYYYQKGLSIISAAERKGILTGVKINPIEQNNIIEPPNNIEL